MDQQESAGSHSGAGTAATTRRWKVQRTSEPQASTQPEPKRVRLLPGPKSVDTKEKMSVRFAEAPQQLTEAETITAPVVADSAAVNIQSAGSHSGDGQASTGEASIEGSPIAAGSHLGDGQAGVIGSPIEMWSLATRLIDQAPQNYRDQNSFNGLVATPGMTISAKFWVLYETAPQHLSRDRVPDFHRVAQAS